MHVKIGPYSYDLVGIRSLESKYERLRFEGDFVGESEYTRFDRIVFKGFDILATVFGPINRWSNNRSRKIKVHLDVYDSWNADHTLALIIYPVLVQLRDTKSGSPTVEVKDVPVHLRPKHKPSAKNGYTDDTVHERWEYVLNEMIWAFEQYVSEDDTAQFYSNVDQLDMKFVPIENSENSKIVFNHQKDPTKPKYQIDKESMRVHQARKQSGLILFGKYFSALWD